MLTAPFEPRREEGFDNVTSMTTRSSNPVPPPPSVGLVDAPQCVSAKGETAVVGPVEIVVVIVQALVGVLKMTVFLTLFCVKMVCITHESDPCV